MSIASDIRSYADTAVTQSKQVLDQALDQAQTQINDVTGQANAIYGKTRENVTELATKATGAVNDLRATAEKAINLDALKTAVEPYIVQVKEYRSSVTDRAETVVAGLKSDKRVGKLVDAAGSVTVVVVETVQERVVKPVLSLTGRGAAPATKPAPAPKPETATAQPETAATAATAATAPTAAASKPATKPAATKPAATKPATRPAVRKAPVRRTTKG
jgi:hypothetical protein